MGPSKAFSWQFCSFPQLPIAVCPPILTSVGISHHQRHHTFLFWVPSLSHPISGVSARCPAKRLPLPGNRALLIMPGMMMTNRGSIFR